MRLRGSRHVNGRYRLLRRRLRLSLEWRVVFFGGPARARGVLTNKAWTCAHTRAQAAVCGVLALTAVGALSACGSSGSSSGGPSASTSAVATGSGKLAPEPLAHPTK